MSCFFRAHAAELKVLLNRMDLKMSMVITCSDRFLFQFLLQTTYLLVEVPNLLGLSGYLLLKADFTLAALRVPLFRDRGRMVD